MPSLCVWRTQHPDPSPELAWGFGWVVTELLWSDLLAPLGSAGRGWERLQSTMSIKSQRSQMETKKRKKGTERNRMVSEKKKKNQLTHPFYPAAPWNQLFANMVLHWLSFHKATVAFQLFSQIMELLLDAYEATQGCMVIHSLNRSLLHLMDSLLWSVVWSRSSLRAEDPRTAGYCRIWQTQR